MAYTVTTTTSYGDRLKRSFKGIASGVLFFIIGTVLLFWNEGNFVKTRKALNEAEGKCVSVESVAQVDSALSGQLIHASARAETQDRLTDDIFGVDTVAIALKRKVEYYQYVEHESSKTKDKIGGGQETVTTYTYSKGWVSRPIESSAFKDPEYKASNKVLTEVKDKDEQAENVTFGAYKLPKFLVSRITGDVPAEVNLTDEQKQEWTKKLGGTAAAAPAPAAAAKPEQMELALDSGQAAAAPAPAAPAVAPLIHVNGNVVYLGKDPSNPQIGDLRITLTKILPADISIIAKVVGSTFEAFKASNGKSVSRLAMGTVSAENMFEAAHAGNNMLTWILRIIGVLCVIGGLKGIFGILGEVFKVLPFLGNIVGAGVGFVCGVVGFAWSLLIIAIAWLTYRPLIGVPLLVVAVAAIVWIKKKGAEKQLPPPAE